MPTLLHILLLHNRRMLHYKDDERLLLKYVAFAFTRHSIPTLLHIMWWASASSNKHMFPMNTAFEKVKRTYFYYYCHSWPKYNNNLCKHCTYNSATVSLKDEAFGGKTIWKVTNQSSLHFLCSQSHVGSIQLPLHKIVFQSKKGKEDKSIYIHAKSTSHHSKMNQLEFIILGSKENVLLSLIGHWYKGSIRAIWHPMRQSFATMLLANFFALIRF